MYRMIPFGWMFGIWAGLASGGSVAPAENLLELSWCTVEASACRLTNGSLRLDGVVGQHDVGTLAARPVVLEGGFLLPGDPVLTLIEPAREVSWRIGDWVTLQCWMDRTVTGDRIRLELWRGQRVAVLSSLSATGPLYSVQVPAVAIGSGYSVRAISERLEAVGNPNPWVETRPIITLVKRTGVTPRLWSDYE